jgi:hypothetical protein
MIETLKALIARFPAVAKEIAAGVLVTVATGEK